MPGLCSMYTRQLNYIPSSLSLSLSGVMYTVYVCAHATCLPRPEEMPSALLSPCSLETGLSLKRLLSWWLASPRNLPVSTSPRDLPASISPRNWGCRCVGSRRVVWCGSWQFELRSLGCAASVAPQWTSSQHHPALLSSKDYNRARGCEVASLGELYSLETICLLLYVYGHSMCVLVSVGACSEVRGRFVPSFSAFMWALGIALSSWALQMRAFTQWAIRPALS